MLNYINPDIVLISNQDYIWLYDILNNNSYYYIVQTLIEQIFIKEKEVIN